jgi:uncharacterized membrane protein YidH (DUF202 family)
VERTHLAAQRTFFSVLRTGLSIAGAGTAVVSIVGQTWPEWLSLLLDGVFLFVGYTMIIVMLNRYQQVMNKLRIQHDLNVISPRLMVVLAVLLQVATAVVLGLFLLGVIRIAGPLDSLRNILYGD